MNGLTVYQEEWLPPFAQDFSVMMTDLQQQGGIVSYVASMVNGFPNIVVCREMNGMREYRKAVRNPISIDVRMIMINMMATIDERNTEIHRLYNVENLTQVEISAIIGISQSQISRILNNN